MARKNTDPFAAETVLEAAHKLKMDARLLPHETPASLIQDRGAWQIATKAAKTLIKAADKGKSSVVLSGIHLSMSDEGKAEACTTDGKILVVCADNTDAGVVIHPRLDDTAELIVSPLAVKLAAALKHEWVQLDAAGHMLIGTVEGLVEVAAGIDGTYPCWRNALLRTRSNDDETLPSIRVLAAMAEYCAAGAPRSAKGVAFHFNRDANKLTAGRLSTYNGQVLAEAITDHWPRTMGKLLAYNADYLATVAALPGMGNTCGDFNGLGRGVVWNGRKGWRALVMPLTCTSDDIHRPDAKIFHF